MTKQDAENAGWTFTGTEETKFVHDHGDWYRKVGGHVTARKQVGDNVLAKSNDTFARLLADVSEWEKNHPARATA